MHAICKAIAVWSKALSVTASLSPLPGFESRPGRVGKLPVTWGLGGRFRRVFRFPPPVTTVATHELAAIWQKK